jgi:hypothetical protein
MPAAQDRREAIALKHHEGKLLSAKKGGTITAGVGKISPAERFVLDTCTAPQPMLPPSALLGAQSGPPEPLTQAQRAPSTRPAWGSGVSQPMPSASAPALAVRRSEFDALYRQPYCSHLTGMNALATRKEEAFAKVVWQLADPPRPEPDANHTKPPAQSLQAAPQPVSACAQQGSCRLLPCG